MFDALKKIRATADEKRRKEDYDRGYNWAAGALLRGEETTLSLEARTYGQKHPFDSGISDAMEKLVALGAIEDDRVIYSTFQSSVRPTIG